MEQQGKENPSLLDREIFEKSLDEFIDSFEVEDDVTKDEEENMKRDFKKYLKESEKVDAEMEKFYNQLQNSITEVDKQFKELQIENIELQSLIEKLGNLVDLARETNNAQFVIKYGGMLDELQSSLTLDILFRNLSRMDNYKKIIYRCEMNYEKEEKRFRLNLFKNQDYKFVDPINLKPAVEEMLPEGKKHYSKLFLFSVYRLANVSGFKSVNRYSIFISQLIKNIYNPHPEEGVDYESLLRDSIIQYVERILS